MHSQHHQPVVQIRTFDQLTITQVAGMYALRYNVFIREQQSIFNEHDGKDFAAIHLFIEDAGQIVAYSRICKESNSVASIGRVAVDQAYRGQSLAKTIVAEAIETIKNMHSVSEIVIEAQEYLQKFYQGFGFVSTSEPFDDDGVLHVRMSLRL
jgi:ElaA protein